LCIASIPKREDPRDVLVSKTKMTLEELPFGARVGTGSLRRRCQLLAVRPDLDIRMIRGNIDTRLRKMQSGEFDAIVLALAGLRRCGLYDSQTMYCIPTNLMLPAAAQGAWHYSAARTMNEPEESSRRCTIR
jgi:hydroxymethylbilane synthase